MGTIGAIVAGILALASGGRSEAIAQTYPAAPVKLIVTTGAGGAPDVIARIVAEGLSRRWGQQVFVANHPGAAGSIGMKVAGTSPADGYTLLFALSSSFVALQRCQAANRSVNDLREPGSNPGLLAGTRPNLTTRP